MRKETSQRPKLLSREQGMISIMTTMVLMIVISLIVLGFAQISRRNQKESLDRQLSTQAFYAAETGVNDARELIQNAVGAGTEVAEKTGCTDSGAGGFYSSLNPVLDAAANVKYSCLLVDPSPDVLRYSDVGTTSIIVPVNSESGEPFSRIKLDWQTKNPIDNPNDNCPISLPASAGNGQFLPTASWACGYGVLRFDLVPTSGPLSVDGLRNSTMTTFAVPFRSGGTTTMPYAASVANVNNAKGVSCSNSSCSLTINTLNANSYYLRISSLYRNVSLQVSGANASGAELEIKGAQAVIDSTGRAQDVLRRIQVNVPLSATSLNQLSDYAIQSTDALCKRFSVQSGFFDSDVNGVTSSNRLCQP